jgi:CO/xanthine dehydrogenase FAD-binding subunit
MKPVAFDYYRARDAADAARVLSGTPDALLIAGGQTLMPLLNMRLARPSLLVDIALAPDMIGVRRNADWLEIGAATRQLDLESDPLVARHCPLLAKAVPWIGHRATRARGTIGGSVAFADPAAELPLVCVALGAEIVTLTMTATKAFSAADFFLGDMTTALPAGGLVTRIRLPVAAEKSGTGFAEVATRQSDFALASAAAHLDVEPDGRLGRCLVAIGAVAGMPQRLPEVERRLSGNRPSRDLVASALDGCDALITARATPTVSESYRRRAAGALLRQALSTAMDEAAAHVR